MKKFRKKINKNEKVRKYFQLIEFKGGRRKEKQKGGRSMKKGRREKEEKEKEGRMEKREGGKASQINAMITTQFQSDEKLLTEF